MTRRLAAAALALALAATLAGCQPERPSTVAPSPSASTPSVDYTQPGAGQAALQALVDASGGTQLVKVELTRTTASVAVVVNDAAQTWSFRDGKPTQVDGDTQFIGQARFKLSDFDLHDVGALFRAAAKTAGSAESQQLQIVEYNAGSIYITVTTQPESQTVFFRADDTQVPVLDFATAEGLRQGLYDVTWNGEVTMIGYLPALGVYAERPGGEGTVLRTIRAARFPVRTEARSDKSTLATFDAGAVDPDVLVRVLGTLTGGRKANVSMVVDRRDGLAGPTIRFTVDGRTTVTDLAGTDITSQVKK